MRIVISKSEWARLGNNISNEVGNKIKGGKADGMSVSDIAKMHGASVEEIDKQLEIGIKSESEHTKDLGLAKEIAIDHLFEFPNYYTELNKMEKGLKKD